MAQKKQKLLALLVGIDQYHPESSPKVSTLNGCVADVKFLEQLLMERYSHLSPEIKVLSNEMATRDNIIKYFREHLRDQANEQTSVLFAYSGHSSQQTSSEIFQKYAADKSLELEETLVCYDSRAENGLDLADKELAILIDEVAAKQAHVVLILDSCHSGNATREDPDAVRLTETRKFPPGFKRQYLDNFYENQLAQEGDITIPRGKHILLAACRREELAHEIKRGNTKRGALSYHLGEILKAGNTLTYASLFSLVQIGILQEDFQKGPYKQNPQFEPYGFFDTQTVFLDATKPEAKRARYFLSVTNDQWVVELGSVSGLPVELNHQSQFAVYETSDSEEIIAYVEAEKVGIKHSHVRIKEGKISKNKSYWAELISLPLAKLPFHIEGDEEAIKTFQQKYTERKSPYLEIVSPEKSFIRIVIQENAYQIFEGEESKLNQKNEGPINSLELVQKLEQIARWKILLQNNNPHTQLNPKAIDLVFIEKDGTTPAKVLGPNKEEDPFQQELLIQAKAGKYFSNPAHEWLIPFIITVRNRSRHPLYFIMLNFSSDYGIEVYQQEYAPRDSQTIVIADGYGLNLRDRTEMLDHFKLIVSTEELQASLFQQPGISAGTTRESLRLDDMVSKPQDWFAKTIIVKSIKS